jgi:hypothetical protein
MEVGATLSDQAMTAKGGKMAAFRVCSGTGRKAAQGDIVCL